ncbi:hypothetical protein D3C81_2183540 [compost metagenome]
MASDAPSSLTWLEAETLRFARRLLRPFTPVELTHHLRVTNRHARRVLHELVEQQLLEIVGGKVRNRTYQLRM